MLIQLAYLYTYTYVGRQPHFTSEIINKLIKYPILFVKTRLTSRRGGRKRGRNPHVLRSHECDKHLRQWPRCLSVYFTRRRCNISMGILVYMYVARSGEGERALHYRTIIHKLYAHPFSVTYIGAPARAAHINSRCLFPYYERDIHCAIRVLHMRGVLQNCPPLFLLFIAIESGCYATRRSYDRPLSFLFFSLRSDDLF